MQSLVSYCRCIAVVCVALVAWTASVPQPSIGRDLRPSDWPSLKVHLAVKRKSMRVYGHSAFTLLANPIVSKDGLSVKYDGYMDLTEGLTRIRYTLLDGLVFATTSTPTQTLSQCIEPSALPLLMDMVAALNEVTQVATATVSGALIACPPGKLMMTKLQGLDLVVCASSSSGFHVYGSDVEIVITYLADRVPIAVPPVDFQSSECEVAMKATAVSDTAVALLTGKVIPDTESRSLFSLNITNTTCLCQSQPRPCLFIHGLGIDLAENELQDSFDMYWGNITDHAPCCTDFKYMIWNSMDTGWDNATQQQLLCDLATSVTSSGLSNEIADTIVITHSMGGLMFAGAIANARCTLARSSSWIAMSAPMAGSMGSDYAIEGCDGKHSVVMETIGNVTGQCPVLSSAQSLVYEGGKMASLSLIGDYKAAQHVYRTRVHAALCSNSYSGLLSLYQPKYWLLGSALPHQSNENDGMVEFQSCAGGLSLTQFGSHYTDRFYVTQLNHADTTFYYGDGLFNSAKKPVKWLECLL